MSRVAWILLLVLSPGAFAVEAAFPTFKVQEIDKTLKVGYGLRIIDLNADGKLDIVVADSARVIWFDQSQDWKLRTIIENARAGVKADNVCLDVADIDGDGKLDVALGADWQPNNTKDGGSLQWLRQGKTIDEWTVHPIAAPIPTLHRIRFADLLNSGKPRLLVLPLKHVSGDVSLLHFLIPKNPASNNWSSGELTSLGADTAHNFLPFANGKGAAVLIANSQGVIFLSEAESDRLVSRSLGSGDQSNKSGPRGSSEIKLGTIGGDCFLATIEPFHGGKVAVYTAAKGSGLYLRNQMWNRREIDDQLKAGHALWCADLDGDGMDEIVAGFREPTDHGVGPGINIYKAFGANDSVTWTKHVLDDKGIACEDLACADLNNDGRIDIVACGRATGNVRIYWNNGMKKN